jgi:ubiquinone/menaquinone biosynthesis C-methylase UbiE
VKELRMDIASMPRKKAYKGLAMEGMIATWYARNTANDLPEFEAEARRIAEHLRPGSRVLEVAPGPGYLAIALARLGSYRVAGIDISRSFVRIASENAATVGAEVEFRHGDAAAIPYPAETFDFIVCRAAFKNFGDPIGALREMHRVLRPGGKTLIIDMRTDASDEEIDRTVDDMKLGRMSALFTRAVFKYSLRKRAYSKADFLRMAAATPFLDAEIKQQSIGLEIWLCR